jgi:transcriptional regulator with XRE-family HTH domain
MPKKKANPIAPSAKEFDYVKFGETLRELIRAKGYTQAVFAEAIGISYPYMMDILNGKRRVQLKTYVKILDILNVSDLVLINDSFSQHQMRECSEVLLELMPLLGEMTAEELEDLLRLAKRIVNK